MFGRECLACASLTTPGQFCPCLTARQRKMRGAAPARQSFRCRHCQDQPTSIHPSASQPEFIPYALQSRHISNPKPYIHRFYILRRHHHDPSLPLRRFAHCVLIGLDVSDQSSTRSIEQSEAEGESAAKVGCILHHLARDQAFLALTSSHSSRTLILLFDTHSEPLFVQLARHG